MGGNISTYDNPIEKVPRQNIEFLIKNPYIHGTNSNILELIKHTEFNLMGPIEMIEKYKIAPMTGEITGGGLDSVWCECEPCFGRIKGSDCNSYDLNKVMRYTTMNLRQHSSERKDLISLLREQVNAGAFRGYSNLNIILIYMVACKQLGYDVTHIVTQDIINDMKMTRNIFASLLFFGTLLQAVEVSDEDVWDAIYTHFDLNYLKTRLSEKIQCNECLEDMDENKVVDILTYVYELPKKSVIKSGMACKDKEVELAITKPFTNEEIDYDSEGSHFQPDYTMYRLMQNVSGYGLRDVLEKYSKRLVSNTFWKNFHSILRKKLTIFKQRLELLENMLIYDKHHHINKVTEDPYPLILICENDEVVKSLNTEFRAIKSLKLGTDITFIATDTVINKEKLIKYLQENNIQCNVILFDDLKAC